MHAPSPALAAFGAAGYGVAIVAQEVPTSATDLFFQMGGVFMALGVGFWLIRRSDAREDSRAARQELAVKEARDAELAAEAALREALMSATRAQEAAIAAQAAAIEVLKKESK